MPNLSSEYSTTTVMNAYGYLLEYLSSAKCGLSSNCDIEKKSQRSDLSGLVDRIVSDLNSNYYIDFYKISSKTEIDKYEQVLNNELIKYTTETLNYDGIKDETELLKHSKIIDNNFFENKEIDFGPSFREKKFFQALGIMKNKLRNFCKKPSCIQMINNDGLEFYKITKAFTQKNQDRLLLVDIFKDKGGYYISSALVFRKNKFHYHIDNPVRMFLLFLHNYGLDIKIGESIRKYLFRIELPINSHQESKPEIIKTKSKYFVIAMNTRIHENKYQYANVYGIDLTRYMIDFKNACI